MAATPPGTPATPVWALDADAVCRRVDSTRQGLTAAEAADRLRRSGANELRGANGVSRLEVFGRQLRSPLLLLLLFAAGVALLTGEWTEAGLVLTIVSATVVIGYSREYSAQSAAAALRRRLHIVSVAVRDGQPVVVPARDLVAGDVVRLAAGSLVPADAVVLEATDFFVNEAVLTGESLPVRKAAGTVAAAARIGERTNMVFMGTNVRSGTATCLIVATGRETAVGAIAHRLTLRAPDTEFDRGLQRFGYLLTVAMLVVVLVVFVAHMLRSRPPVETLLFAVALAVGLSPELLPAILSVNLARGARTMAQRGVLVRRLNAIENLGSMDVLCTDKTGTLTEGVVRVEGAYDADGAPSAAVLHLAALNAALETGVASPLDDAIAAAETPDLSSVHKRGEIPFDFVRRRVTVVVEDAGRVRLIVKGAVHHVLDACGQLADGTPLAPDVRQRLEARHDAWSRQGIRVLGVATRDVPPRDVYGREEEADLAFAGFVTFLDRPKPGVAEAIAALRGLGVTLKLITGDTRLVAEHVARLVGIPDGGVLTGRDLNALHDDALPQAAERTTLFVEVDPHQKERIIVALRRMGHVVGFLGDGVNDAPAMHVADTSLSVEQAVDVAREAADFVLLEQGLDVIRRGVEEGRRTFANTLKYVLITTSANLGNMISMAVTSLFLPFLPLTAAQVLLNNLLSDVPAFALADDNTDDELVDRPRRWDIRFIGSFMWQFGALSSAFDLLLFATLLRGFHAGEATFRTAWFVESLLTELAVAFVMRSERPFFRSRPGHLLLVSSGVLVGVALVLPYLPWAAAAGFVPLPLPVLAVAVLIVAAYVAATEVQKRWFYRRRGRNRRLSLSSPSR